MPNEYWDVNVAGSSNVFLAAHNIPVVYASSSSVYEWWLSPYSITKHVTELIAPDKSIGLRFHTVYGPDSRPDMLYDRLLKRDPTLTYLTNHTRDYTHVEDVVDAIDLCIENFNHVVYNMRLRTLDVGYGTPVTVKEVADKVWPDNNFPLKQVKGEREHTCANPGPLLELGWNPKHSILNS
jgi:nucleoside-diphosphate-sugar epimerase